MFFFFFNLLNFNQFTFILCSLSTSIVVLLLSNCEIPLLYSRSWPCDFKGYSSCRQFTTTVYPLLLITLTTPSSPKLTESPGRSSDGDIDRFDTVAGILQKDTLVPYLFIICLNNELRTSIEQIKENGFILKKQEADDILQKLLGTQTMQMT